MTTLRGAVRSCVTAFRAFVHIAATPYQQLHAIAATVRRSAHEWCRSSSVDYIHFTPAVKQGKERSCVALNRGIVYRRVMYIAHYQGAFVVVYQKYIERRYSRDYSIVENKGKRKLQEGDL